MYPAQSESKSRGGYDIYLMEKIVSRENMMKTLKRVEENKGAPGVDDMPVESLRPYLFENWLRIKEELLHGTYQTQPVRRVEIPKRGGGVRLYPHRNGPPHPTGSPASIDTNI